MIFLITDFTSINIVLMGIQKFNALFKSTIKSGCVTDLSGKVVVVDANNLLNRHLIGQRNRGDDIRNSTGKKVGHLVVIFRFVIKLRKSNIYPVFVFDGKPSQLKLSTIDERRVKKHCAIDTCTKISDKADPEYIKYFKRCFELKSHEIEECMELLSAMGVPYIRAPFEADAQCAAIAKYYSNVAGVVSDDSDMLLYGCGKLYKNFSVRNNFMEDVDVNNIIKYLQDISDHARKLVGKNPLTVKRSNFLDICIILGTEYNKRSRILGCRPIELVMLYAISDYNVRKMINRMDRISLEGMNIFIPDDFYENYLQIKNEYLDTKVIHPRSIPIDYTEIDRDMLKNIMNDAISDDEYIDNGIRFLEKRRPPRNLFI